jgi:4-hydroxy-3-methylbut-2-en-1-yl diphosphate reductase
MVEIKIAKNSGFCFGVKRAIEIAEEVAQNNSGTNTYVLGQLVHNERVISELEKKGIVFANSIEEIPQNAITVLRAHGEPGTTYHDLQKRDISKGKNLNDATCPLVTLVHNVAIKLKEAGYEVMIFGKSDHPESIGTAYHLKGSGTFIVEHEYDSGRVVDFINKGDFEKYALISQTTMSVYGYKKLVDDINSKMKHGRFEQVPLSMKDLTMKYGWVDTICNPTKQRQTGTEELAKESDIMIVIGGLNSSNSKELHAKCKEIGTESHFIQSAGMIKPEWYLIEEVVERIRDIVDVS